jgi:Ni/Co efflux regulator RcnB
MIRKTGALLAPLLLVAHGLVLAQPDHRGPPGHGPGPGMERHDDGRGRGPEWRGHEGRGPERRGPEGRRFEGRGPYHDVYVGRRLPDPYWNRHYRVDDWRRHGLRPPPRGQVWVQIGADYALVDARNGVVISFFAY